MNTVASRTFRSSPYRDALDTWTAIAELLTGGINSTTRVELAAVAGIAASIIADQATKDAPIVVTCDGPRTRIYCSYDDDAIEGSDANEDMLGFDALRGDWRISLPCCKEDLSWVQSVLQKASIRITARDSETALLIEAADSVSDEALEINLKGFLGA